MYEFKLPSSLTISGCDELIKTIIEVKENNKIIKLDSSEVETIDTAGIQLIYSLCIDEEQISHNNMSDKVSEVMAGLGLDSI